MPRLSEPGTRSSRAKCSSSHSAKNCNNVVSILPESSSSKSCYLSWHVARRKERQAQLSYPRLSAAAWSTRSLAPLSSFWPLLIAALCKCIIAILPSLRWISARMAPTPTATGSAGEAQNSEHFTRISPVILLLFTVRVFIRLLCQKHVLPYLCMI